MGYYPDISVFAGFDLSLHRKFTAGSPSVQIEIGCLNAALQHGLGFSTKDNQEIAIGVRPDQFINYITTAESLHRLGTEAKTLSLLIKASEISEINEQDIADLISERQKVVANVSRYSRDANFRKKVLNAYENRCAITRAQLKLVDAAHILPVPSEESSDHITNGIALSPTMHRAFDSTLIFLDDNFVVHLNEEKALELKDINLAGGLAQIQAFMDSKIHLPADPQQAPNRDYIRKADMYRRIPNYY